MELAVRLLLLVNVLLVVFPYGKCANFSVRSDWEENQFGQIIDGIEENSHSLLRSFTVPANNDLTSPYQVLPGSYAYGDNSYYQSGDAYNPKVYKYLATGAYQYHSAKCSNHYGQVPQIPQIDMDNAFQYANHEMMTRFPEYANKSHYKSADHKEVEGQMMELVSEYFGKYKCFSKLHLVSYLPTISIGKQYEFLNGVGDVSCTPYYDQHYECSKQYASKYRTIDGSCNNRYRPYWGRSNICHIRLLPPDYSDGVKSFRMAKDGYPLPNPRSISNYAASSKDFKSYYTSLLLGWGQFINHDITNTANNKQSPTGYDKVDCCVKPDSKCVAITIDDDQNDYISVKKKGRCLNFMRSSPCPLCKLGPREQLNSQTSFLDGSQIYGSTDKQAAELRAFQNGLLLSAQDRYGKPILPPSDKAKPCTPLKKELKCFMAGDSRVNQHPILLSLHTLWLRNHNQHALKLKQVNPHWGDEKLYQEARRITIAELQHITFNEYLPIILGSILSGYYSLSPLERGYTNYEAYTDPSSWNEFTTAASRYGHSQIKDYYKTISANLVNSSLFLLKDNFFEPGFAWDGLIDDVIRGITSEPANTIDPYYSLTAKNFVMREKGKSFGLDLVATNVQRGRDHGIPGYVHFLKVCFNYHAKSWKDLEKFIPSEALSRLQTLYNNIEDIDLYIAGVSEKHFIDASIGPTFGCLVGIQFYHIKFGDRYYYEHGNQHGSFSPAQLDNIRISTSIARVLCRNGHSLQQMQRHSFYLPSKVNHLVDCSQFLDINYQLWKE